MGFKRACRVGETISIPLLCDPVVEENASNYIAAEAKAAFPAGTEDDAVDAFMRDLGKRLLSEAARFAETFDEAVISTPLAGVTRATIRGLSGAQFATAEAEGLAAAAEAKCSDEHRPAYIQTEIIRLGLVSLDGFDLKPAAGLYPVEALMGPDGIGSAWRQVRREISGRIADWSHLGKPASSSSEP